MLHLAEQWAVEVCPRLKDVSRDTLMVAVRDAQRHTHANAHGADPRLVLVLVAERIDDPEECLRALQPYQRLAQSHKILCSAHVECSSDREQGLCSAVRHFNAARIYMGTKKSLLLRSSQTESVAQLLQAQLPASCTLVLTRGAKKLLECAGKGLPCVGPASNMQAQAQSTAMVGGADPGDAAKPGAVGKGWMASRVMRALSVKPLVLRSSVPTAKASASWLRAASMQGSSALPETCARPCAPSTALDASGNGSASFPGAGAPAQPQSQSQGADPVACLAPLALSRGALSAASERFSGSLSLSSSVTSALGSLGASMRHSMRWGAHGMAEWAEGDIEEEEEEEEDEAAEYGVAGLECGARPAGQGQRKSFSRTSEETRGCAATPGASVELPQGLHHCSQDSPPLDHTVSAKRLAGPSPGVPPLPPALAAHCRQNGAGAFSSGAISLRQASASGASPRTAPTSSSSDSSMPLRYPLGASPSPGAGHPHGIPHRAAPVSCRALHSNLPLKNGPARGHAGAAKGGTPSQGVMELAHSLGSGPMVGQLMTEVAKLQACARAATSAAEEADREAREAREESRRALAAAEAERERRRELERALDQQRLSGSDVEELTSLDNPASRTYLIASPETATTPSSSREGTQHGRNRILLKHQSMSSGGSDRDIACFNCTNDEESLHRSKTAGVRALNRKFSFQDRDSGHSQSSIHDGSPDCSASISASSPGGTRCRHFSFCQLAEATNGFCDDTRLLGRGAYGSVYRGQLHGCQVAVKRLDVQSANGIAEVSREFQTEVEVLCRVRHPNIVLLMGHCQEAACIVYEYMAGGSLQDRLRGEKGSPCASTNAGTGVGPTMEYHTSRGALSSPLCRVPPLPPATPSRELAALQWPERFRIAAEVSGSLLFLHSHDPPIIHRDLKPSNILLDAHDISKVSDVGMAKLVLASEGGDDDDSLAFTIRGTMGYIDPDELATGQLSEDSDTYAFGLILLQLITGITKIQQIHKLLDSAAGPRGLRSAAPAVDAVLDRLDSRAGRWPVPLTAELVRCALRCVEWQRCERARHATEVHPLLVSLAARANAEKERRQHEMSSRLVCPLSQKRMQDPVLAADGFTYERVDIEKWLQSSSVSPVTGTPLAHNSLTPNNAVAGLLRS